MGHLRISRREVPDPEAMKELLDSLTPEERTVIHAAAIAMGKERVRLTDRRLLVIFVLVVAVGAWLLHAQSSSFDHFRSSQQRQNAATLFNCHQTQSAFDEVNGYFDRQIALTRARTDLAPAVKAQALANLQKSKLKPLRCAK